METKEAQTKLFKLYISNLKMAIDKIDDVVEAVKLFDGKVINKRFDTALDKAVNKNVAVTKKLYIDVTSDTCKMRITFSFWNYREVFADEKYYWEEKTHRQVHYLPSGFEDVNIFSCYSSFNRYDDIKNKDFYSKETTKSYFFIDENHNLRLNASLVVKGLTEEKAELVEKVKELEKIDSLQVQQWRDKTEELKKEVEKLRETIPYSVRIFFELPVYATFQVN